MHGWMGLPSSPGRDLLIGRWNWGWPMMGRSCMWLSGWGGGTPLASVTQRDGPVFMMMPLRSSSIPTKMRDFIIISWSTPSAQDMMPTSSTVLAGMGWQAEVRIVPDGWEGLVTIPFISLGGPPEDGQEWGFQRRHRPGEAEFASWAPHPGDLPCTWLFRRISIRIDCINMHRGDGASPMTNPSKKSFLRFVP